ncbi:MAG: alpha/beta fold hydrolase [Candidatus Rokuibacteriota bacterium]
MSTPDSASADLVPTRYRVTTTDGVELALTRFSGETTRPVPVVLTHGTFSNARICGRLAAHLATHGFDCWVLELRGRGESQQKISNPTFEDFGVFDVPAALEAVRAHTGRHRFFLVGHSGGGLAFLMHLARIPGARAGVVGLVTLASQATDACTTLGGCLMVGFGWVAETLLGYAPGRACGVGPENEPKGILRQWFRWNLARRWTGSDGFDYLRTLPEITVPALCMAGAGDRYIAPVRGCRRLFDALGGADKEWVLCGKSGGFSEDYGHARIVASRAAEREIWPRIREWLVART